MLQISRAIIQLFEEAEETMAQFKGITGGKLNVAVISADDYFFHDYSWSSSVAIPA